MIETDEPDDMSAKSEFMRLSHWRDQIVHQEQYVCVTDRWGDPLEAPAWVDLPETDFDRLVHCMGNRENSFIAGRLADRMIGILFEEEFLSPESNGEEVDKTIPVEDVERDILYKAYSLERRFPQATVSVTVGAHVFDGRYALRVFVPWDIITYDLGVELGDALSQG